MRLDGPALCDLRLDSVRPTGARVPLPVPWGFFPKNLRDSPSVVRPTTA